MWIYNLCVCVCEVIIEYNNHSGIPDVTTEFLTTFYQLEVVDVSHIFQSSCTRNIRREILEILWNIYHSEHEL